MLPLNVAKLLCATSDAHPHTTSNAKTPNLFMGRYLSGSAHLKGIAKKYYAALSFDADRALGASLVARGLAGHLRIGRWPLTQSGG